MLMTSLHILLRFPFRNLTLDLVEWLFNFMNIFYHRSFFDYSVYVRKQKTNILPFLFACLPFRSDENMKKKKLISKWVFFFASCRVNWFRNLTCDDYSNAKTHLCGWDQKMQFYKHPSPKVKETAFIPWNIFTVSPQHVSWGTDRTGNVSLEESSRLDSNC